MEVLGHKGMPISASAHVYRSSTGFLRLTLPIDGRPASAGNGGTIGFHCSSPSMVDRWHAAGASRGGSPIEEPPGIRDSPLGRVYVAYLRDPDHNKLCAFHACGEASA